MNSELYTLFLGALCGLGHAVVLIGAFSLLDRLSGRPFFVEPDTDFIHEN